MNVSEIVLINKVFITIILKSAVYYSPRVPRNGIDGKLIKPTKQKQNNVYY